MTNKTILNRNLLALTLTLGLIPATCSASTLFSFSNSTTTGTVGTNTVSGINLNTFQFLSSVGSYAAGTTCTVNAIESYNVAVAGALTFAVNGAGALGAANCSNGLANPFTNVTGTFITITEPVTFGSSPLNLFNAVTNLNVQSAFLTDLALTGSASLVSPTSISLIYQAGGAVTSINNTFALNGVPEPSTLPMFAGGLLAVAGLLVRRKLIPAAFGK